MANPELVRRKVRELIPSHVQISCQDLPLKEFNQKPKVKVASQCCPYQSETQNTELDREGRRGDLDGEMEGPSTQ